MCFDEKTGAFLWQLVVPKLASGKVNDWENLGLLSSPCVEGNRVYLVTSRCEVICLSTEGMASGNNEGPFMDEAQYVAGPGNPPAKIGPHDADIIWRYDMMDELGVFPHNASNCSLLIVGDYIYACTSNGQDWTHVNIPSPFAPALSCSTRKPANWSAEDNAGIGPRIFHGQWSSPSTGVVNGQQLIFFGGGDGICYAFDADTAKGNRRAHCARRARPAHQPVRGQRHRLPEKSVVVRLQSPPNAAPAMPPTNTRPRTAPAKSTPRRSSGITASMSRSARTPNTARASASLIVLTPPKPATSPRSAKSGATTKSTAASPPFPSRPTACCSSAIFPASSIAWTPRRANSIGSMT